MLIWDVRKEQKRAISYKEILEGVVELQKKKHTKHMLIQSSTMHLQFGICLAIVTKASEIKWRWFRESLPALYSLIGVTIQVQQT